MATLNAMAEILNMPIWLLMLVLVWTFTWKGIALWKSARNSHLFWFIILLVLNTIGILEILYIFLFSKIKLEIEKPKTKLKKRKRKTK